MNDLLIDALAVARLTRLVVSDTILDTPRARALVALETRGHHKVAYLLGCPWCVSPYVAAAVVIARARYPRAWAPVARAFAFSAVAGAFHEATTAD